MGKQDKLMFRVPNTKEGRHDLQRIKKSLNIDSYSMWTKFTGPRPKGTPQGSTLKENATSIRVYIDSKREVDNINPYEYIQRGRDIEKGQQALKNARVDNVLSIDELRNEKGGFYTFSNEENQEIQKLKEQNLLLETKLSLLLAGLQNSNKYRHFIDTVNSITHVNLSKISTTKE